MDDPTLKKVDRREFVKSSVHTLAGLSIGVVSGLPMARSSKEEMVWQLDPDVCVQCE